MVWTITLAGLMILISNVRSDTIHFTNSPNHLTQTSNFTTYKLDVPGSDGITIIEANGKFQSPIDRKGLNLMAQDGPDYEEHDLKTLHGQKKMVYAPDLLTKFINEYNAKTNGEIVSDQKQSSSIENEPAIRFGSKTVKQSNNNNNNPFDSKEGWVTLEAVPWSRSQVTKWKPNTDSETINTLSSAGLYNSGHITSLDKGRINYGTNIDDHNDKFSNYPTNRPSFYQHEDNKHDDFYDRNVLKPTKFEKLKPNAQRKKDQGYYSSNDPELELSSNHDRWYDYGFRPDFESGSNLDPYQNDYEYLKPASNSYNLNSKRDPYRHHVSIPATNSYSTRPESSYTYEQRPDSVHPPTHPSNGNGKWVLVSTTKGYQYPSRSQRGISFNSTLNSNNYNVKAHKSIKLTVLPAEATASNQTPMITSHGGLLEVESSQQTVENSARRDIKNKTKEKSKIKKKLKSSRNNGEIIQAVPIESNVKADTSAVLAAVGAGMVPATVAMLMPMLGRKKRQLIEDSMSMEKPYHTEFFH